MNKSVVVTGTSSGLGAEIAKEIRNRKYSYYELTKFNCVDVSKHFDVKFFFDDLREEYLKNESKDIKDFPCALINNAGICNAGSIFELSENDWTDQIDTNLNGVFYCSKYYSKILKEFNLKGKIINIASTAGLSPRAGRSGYSSSKAGVINFSLSISEELKQYGIKVYTICPGAFDSKLRRKLYPDDDFQNMLKPNKIARFVCNLIEDGEFLDGQIIKIKK